MLAYAFVLFSFTVVAIYGRGVPLQVTANEINDASAKSALGQLFRDKVNAHTIVMFTGSACGLSRGAKTLMDSKFPNQLYYYYDYDTQPMGVYFIYESTKAKNSTSNKLPHIWICGRYIGGLPELRNMESNKTLESTLKSCPKSK